MLALSFLIILGVDWASGYAIAGYCMAHGVNPYGYAFWQAFGPFVVLLCIQMLRRKVTFNKNEIFYAILCGVFAIVIPNLLIYLSVIHVASGLLTVIANIAPIFTYVFAVILGDEKFQFKRIIFVTIGLVGVGLILLPNWHGLSIDLGSWWLYIALLIPLSYAFSAVYISKFRPQGGDVFSYALWMLLVATLCISPLTVFSHGYYPLTPGDLNSNLILLEILLSTFGYVLVFIVIRMVGSVYYTLVNSIAAITGVIYGYLLFQQTFSNLVYAALAIVIIAIMGLTITQRKN